VTGAASKRERPRAWDDAQVIAWIVHRTWAAVTDAKGVLDAIKSDRAVLDAREGKARGVRSVALPLAILFEHDNPYFADGITPTTGRFAGLYKVAEHQFRNAIAGGRLQRRKDLCFNSTDVQRKDLWPSNGSGNSGKYVIGLDLINKINAVIADGAEDQTRADVFRELRLKGFAKQQRQSASCRDRQGDLRS
jgi:hypothetical protein